MLLSLASRRYAINTLSKSMTATGAAAALPSSLSSSSSSLTSSNTRLMTTHGFSGIQKVTVVGAGTLGTQVALQTAITGHDVTVLDVSEDSLQNCRKNHELILQSFLEREQDPSKVQARAWTNLTSSSSSSSNNNSKDAERVIQETLGRLMYTTDPAQAMDGCELVSENVPEVPEIKSSTYTTLTDHIISSNDNTQDIIFTTNSSTLLPSDFVDVLPEQYRSNFLALHFANGIWDANIGEIMPHPGTDPAITERVVNFAKDIRMVPFHILKEQNGYIINSLLVPWLNAAQTLVTNGVVQTPSEVDKAWLISMGGYHHTDLSTIRAPFIVMDQIGVPLVANVLSYWGEVSNDAQMTANGNYLQTHYVDHGKHGITNGNPSMCDPTEGIYSYPHPEYMNSDFMH